MTRSPLRHLLTLIFCALVLLLSACNEDDFNFGSDCRNNGDCGDDLFCCTEKKCKNICTYTCGNDDDCPGGWVCHNGNYCLFRCDKDGDCPGGYKCKNDGDRKVCSGD